MVLEIGSIDNSKVDKFYEKSMKELSEFFGINWKNNAPNLILVKDRKTIDALRKKKTEDWVVGWAENGILYVLSPENYEKESSHKYSDEEYYALLKHELAHCFTNIVSGYSPIPRWLNEGVSIYLSGQNKFKKNFKKFQNFLSFHDYGGKDVYSESGFAVQFLVEEYGKLKLMKLIKSSGNLNGKKFKDLFEKVYGFELNYKNFNDLLKK